jgi:hypothetical protein
MQDPKRLAAMRELAAEIWPEDGTPVETHLDPGRAGRRARQEQRLLGRITRIVRESLALAEDPRLRASTLVDVALQSQGRVVRVVLDPLPTDLEDAAAAWLQSELTHQLSRRRTPTVRVVGGAA